MESGTAPAAPHRDRPALRNSDVALVLAFVGILLVLLIPLPTFILDVSISTNIALSLLILVITLSCREALELSTFPTILLFATLLRLGLNVASTRLILLNGDAGSVIAAFGDFVLGGNLVVGIVVFLILLVIQFVVITKGSNRISEVAARFILDAMPGKQMAIDADLSAGIIKEDEARRRRENVSREAEFYGAMDGAGKFVRGDAIAGLIIVVVNLVAGVVIGITKDMSVGDALRRYALLTVGDGLVSQIPALIVSLSAGIIVTKTSSRTALSDDLTFEFLRNPRAIGIAGVILILFGLAPGLPGPPFLILGGLMLALRTFALGRADRGDGSSAPGADGRTAAAEGGAETSGAPADPEGFRDVLRVDRLGLELGFRLVQLVEAGRKGGLLDQITAVRRRLATALGIVVPAVRIRDNIEIDPGSYRILIQGQEVARGQLRPDACLAMNPGNADGRLEGHETVDPTFGLPATWIPQSRQREAEALGYTVVDAPAVLVTHLLEVLRSHAAEILSRDDVQEMIDRVKETSPAAVADLVPDTLTLGEVQQVLQLLLEEGVAVRNLPAIFERLSDIGRKVKDPEALVEAVRQRLGRALVAQHADPGGRLPALTLDPRFERTLEEALSPAGADRAGLSPALIRSLQEAVARGQAEALRRGRSPVLLVKAGLRRHVAQMLRSLSPRVSVLSWNECIEAPSVDALGVVAPEAATAAAAA